ncbi:MAG: PolC-type DNA polymerase III [Myxococcota bacterium]
MTNWWFKERRPTMVDHDEPIVRRYLHYDWSRLMDAPIERVRFVVFDCETSGLDVRQDQMLSLSAVGIHGGAISLGDRLDVLFRREDTGGAVAAQIHGILPRDLADGDDVQSAVLSFLSFCRGAVLVGHHVAFDVAMIEAVTEALWNVRLQNPRLDTAHLYQRVTSAAGSGQELDQAVSLDALLGTYGITSRGRHSASGDAYATALLLVRLLHLAGRRGLWTARQMGVARAARHSPNLA